MMRRLLHLSKRINTFLKMDTRDKLILIEAFILSGIVRAIIFFIPFNRIKKYIGTYNSESPEETESSCYEMIKKVAWAVALVSNYTPWESKCLVQALTAQKMLKKRHIYSTLYLGVAREGENKLNAHAWLRSGRVLVTGGYGWSRFKVVAKFSNSYI